MGNDKQDVMRIGVVIPYYQREAGLLGRAIRSVVDQSAVEATITILVVDDGSPRPARLDLDGLDCSSCQVTLIEQTNAGPGAARNAALDRLATDAPDLVAFLDSDDVWMPHHLRTAIDALGSGHDFYFCNHDRQQYGAETSYLSAHGRLRRWLDDGSVEQRGDGIMDCNPRFVTSHFLSDFPAQTSTVVYRFTPALAEVRFDNSMRLLGEDLLFLFQIAREARKTCFSSAIGVHCGVGVSLYHSTLSWDHPDAPLRFAYGILLWSKVLCILSGVSPERSMTIGRIKGLKRAYLFMLTRHFVRGRRLHWGAIRLARQHRLFSWADLVRSGTVLLYLKLRRRTLFPEH